MKSWLLEWARGALLPLSTVAPESPWEDLAPVGSMIDGATVVALSEGAHGAAEPLEFRNRLFQYLVQEHGFTAIAIESGVVEGRLLHDYVRGAPGDLNSVLGKGINWTHDKLPQNRSLIRWLREYNSEPTRHRKVNFYGFDMPGCPSSTRETFGYDTAVHQVLLFLSRVDPIAGNVFRSRLENHVTAGRFHPARLLDAVCYGRMSQLDRDTLTAAIADLITWLERHESKYAAASSVDDYAWAHRAAIGARQIDSWLREIPTGWVPPAASVEADEWPQFFFVGTDIRDRAQADNIEWIVKREGAQGKILMFASRYHLSTSTIKVSRYPDGKEYEQEVAGTYLRRHFGSRLLTIGNLIGQGDVACGGYAQELGAAPAQSLDAMAGEVGPSLFLLDLRRAPLELSRWLEEEHQLVVGSQAIKLSVCRAFDVLFYINKVTPACAGPAHADVA